MASRRLSAEASWASCTRIFATTSGGNRLIRSNHETNSAAELPWLKQQQETARITVADAVGAEFWLFLDRCAYLVWPVGQYTAPLCPTAWSLADAPLLWDVGVWGYSPLGIEDVIVHKALAPPLPWEIQRGRIKAGRQSAVKSTSLLCTYALATSLLGYYSFDFLAAPPQPYKGIVVILFHYTCVEHMSAIISEGLYKGDVPLVAGKPGYRGVWFTTDDNPSGHGLSEGETIVLPEVERRLYKQKTGREAPVEAKTANKRAIRIEVIIPSRDKNLIHWLPWSVKRTDPNLREALIKTGGGKSKAKTWFFYNGIIEPARFKTISLRDDTGAYQVVSPDIYKQNPS